MGVDHEACVAYGVYFTANEDIQELLKLTEDEYTDLVDDNLGCYMKCASSYDNKGTILYLPKSLVSINRYDDHYIKGFCPHDFKSDFWLAIGDQLTTKIQKLGKNPQWYLMYHMY